MINSSFNVTSNFTFVSVAVRTIGCVNRVIGPISETLVFANNPLIPLSLKVIMSCSYLATVELILVMI